MLSGILGKGTVSQKGTGVAKVVQFLYENAMLYNTLVFLFPEVGTRVFLCYRAATE